MVLKQLDEERRYLVRDGEIIEVLPCVTRLRWESHKQFAVVFSALTPANADAAILQEIKYHSELNVGFEWKLYAHDQPPDLLQRLQAHSFDIGQCEAVMVFDLSRRPAWLIQPDEGSTIQIKTLEQLDAYRHVAEAIFSKDYSFTTDALATALRNGSSQHRAYMAFAGNDPVSIGRLYTHPKSAFAGLYGGGTLPGYRGQGHYRAIVTARARDAAAQGSRYLVVDALPTSRPILERLGFGNQENHESFRCAIQWRDSRHHSSRARGSGSRL